MENFSTSANGLEKILTICLSGLDNFAPRKKKYSREKNMPFMNQALGKDQMKDQI